MPLLDWFKKGRPLKSSITATDPVKFLRSNEITHMLIVLDGRALLQQYGSDTWSAPCVKWYYPKESTPEWAPEVPEFQHQFLKGARWFCHGHLLRPGVPLTDDCEHAVVTRLEPVSSLDHTQAIRSIEGLETMYPGKLRLFTLSEVENMNDAQWCDIGRCQNCSGGTLRQAISSAMSESADPNNVPALRPPWERYGWIDEVWGWVASHLPNQPQQFEMRHVDVWPFGITMCVYITNSEKRYWFKASPVPEDMHPVDAESSPSEFQRAVRYKFSNEVRVAHLLSREHPEVVPKLLASDGEKGWMLVEDAGISFYKLGWWSRKRFVTNGSQTYAKLQLSYNNRNIEELVKEGLRDRRPRLLPQHLESVLSTRKNDPGFARFAESGMMDRVRRLCEVLEQGSVPNGLVHGDITAGSLFKSKDTGELQLIDWRDACLSNLLFDDEIGSISTISKRAAHGYACTVGLTGAEAIPLFNAARPLALLHRAITCVGYSESIEPSNVYHEAFLIEAQHICSQAADLIEEQQLGL